MPQPAQSVSGDQIIPCIGGSVSGLNIPTRKMLARVPHGLSEGRSKSRTMEGLVSCEALLLYQPYKVLVPLGKGPGSKQATVVTDQRAEPKDHSRAGVTASSRRNRYAKHFADCVHAVDTGGMSPCSVVQTSENPREKI